MVCKRNSIDIVVDLETTGRRAGCAVLSIGATSLDLEESFYGKISHEDSILVGLQDDPETLAWWSEQSEEVKTEAFSGTERLNTVLWEFSDWWNFLTKKYGNVYIWGNGADFDLPILQGAFHAVDREKPWKPFNGRCYRTLKNLPINRSILAGEFIGIKHNALDDARHQAKHLHRILKWNKDLLTYTLPSSWDSIPNTKL